MAFHLWFEIWMKTVANLWLIIPNCRDMLGNYSTIWHSLQTKVKNSWDCYGFLISFQFLWNDGIYHGMKPVNFAKSIQIKGRNLVHNYWDFCSEALNISSIAWFRARSNDFMMHQRWFMRSIHKIYYKASHWLLLPMKKVNRPIVFCDIMILSPNIIVCVWNQP